jgi:hypothetical protein
MKKIAIIFIIALCLLSFMEIYGLAKESGSPGKLWNYMHKTDKVAYLAGVIGGVNMCINQFADYPPSQFTNKEDEAKLYALIKDDFHFIELFRASKKTEDLIETFIKVMSDLYKDPANMYIRIANMCIVASRKLRGEPIESLLRELRKEALP